MVWAWLGPLGAVAVIILYDDMFQQWFEQAKLRAPEDIEVDEAVIDAATVETAIDAEADAVIAAEDDFNAAEDAIVDAAEDTILETEVVVNDGEAEDDDSDFTFNF